MAEIMEEEKICAMVAKEDEQHAVENGFIDEDDVAAGEALLNAANGIPRLKVIQTLSDISTY